jgi:hypothetical protein
MASWFELGHDSGFPELSIIVIEIQIAENSHSCKECFNPVEKDMCAPLISP